MIWNPGRGTIGLMTLLDFPRATSLVSFLFFLIHSGSRGAHRFNLAELSTKDSSAPCYRWERGPPTITLLDVGRFHPWRQSSTTACVRTTKESEGVVFLFFFPRREFKHVWLGGFSLVLEGGSAETLLESHFLKTVRSLLQNEMFLV